MLSDWYFCTALQLPLQQAVSHLQMLSALREGVADPALVPDELLADVIEGVAYSGQWRMLHALAPALAVQQVRSAPLVTRAAEDYCAKLLDSCVGNDARTSAALHGLFQKAFAGTADGGLAGEVTGVADQVLSQPPAMPPADTPYLDLVDFAVPIILLSLLDMLSRRDAASVRECSVGTDRAAWFIRALEGGYGRQALLLAVAIAARAGDTDAPAALTRPDVGVVDMEPDMLACYARAYFARNGDPVGEQMTKYEVEAVSGRSLPEPIPHPALANAREAVSQRLCGQARMSRSLGPVLWHMTMWELAAERDPADCALRLQRWWGVPPEPGEPPFDGQERVRIVLPWGGDRAVLRRLGGLLQLRANEQRVVAARARRPQARRGRGEATGTPAAAAPEAPKLWLDEGGAGSTLPEMGSAVFSPWTYRKSDFVLRGNIEPSDYLAKTQFPGFMNPVCMIRLLAGTALAVRVLRAQPDRGPCRVELLSLMMHGKDVLGDCRFRPIREAAEAGTEPDPESVVQTLVPRPLHGLAQYVERVVDQAGKGYFDKIDPATLTRFLLPRAFGQQAADGKTLSRQELKLHKQSATVIAVAWVKEALSGYGGRRDEHAGTRWFTEDQAGESAALQLLTSTVESDQGDQPRQAAAVLLQLAPDRFYKVQPTMAGWDWCARKEGLQGKFDENVRKGYPKRLVLNANGILCAPLYSVEQWQVVTSQVEQWIASQGPLSPLYTTMLATRLEAVLRDPAADSAEPYRPWVQAFLDRVRAMVTVKELPRELRALMINWVPADQPRSIPPPVGRRQAGPARRRARHVD